MQEKEDWEGGESSERVGNRDLGNHHTCKHAASNAYSKESRILFIHSKQRNMFLLVSVNTWFMGGVESTVNYFIHWVEKCTCEKQWSHLHVHVNEKT